MTGIAQKILMFRRFSTVPTVVDTLDTLGIEDRSPGLLELGRAAITFEAVPFRALVADIDAYFDGELDEALTGPESAEAEAQVRRIITENLGRATTRLNVGTTLLPQTNWATADSAALQHHAHVILQRAADRRFVEIVSPTVVKPTA